MNKPKRILPEMRVVMPICEISFNKGRAQGHTQSCDDWEAFLPDEAEILLILTKAFKVFKSGKGKFNSYEYTVSEMIAKRIGK